MTKVLYKVNNKKLQHFKYNSLLQNQHPYYINQLTNTNNRLYELFVNNTSIGSIIYSLNKTYIYIHIIFIFKEHRNKGYATQVINFIKKFNKQINIAIDGDNKQNIKFWTNRGFKYQGKLKINSNETDLFYVYNPQ